MEENSKNLYLQADGERDRIIRRKQGGQTMSSEKKIKKKSTKWIVLSVTVVAIILGVFCWTTMPQSLNMQFTMGMTRGTTVSKNIAIPVALGACLLGAVLYWNDDEEVRPLVFSACGLIIYLIILILNL